MAVHPATADRFGLEDNWWYDGRRDIVAATDAALAYFSFLYQTFDDWYLALAGYNAGEGNVRRALRKAKVNEITSDTYWHLPLPQETKRYVPRLLAYAAIIAEPQRYDIALPETTTAVTFKALELPEQFDLMKIAHVLELEIDEVYRLNPALNQWATPPEGPHRLLVPADATDAADRLHAVPANERVKLGAAQDCIRRVAECDCAPPPDGHCHPQARQPPVQHAHSCRQNPARAEIGAGGSRLPDRAAEQRAPAHGAERRQLVEHRETIQRTHQSAGALERAIAEGSLARWQAAARFSLGAAGDAPCALCGAAR